MTDIRIEAKEVYKGHVGQDLVGARGLLGGAKQGGDEVRLVTSNSL